MGHITKENKQWKQLLTGKSVKIVFNGSNSYVSLTYHSNPGQPILTWNYAIVHFQGNPVITEEA